jgi:hypothetical protein
LRAQRFIALIASPTRSAVHARGPLNWVHAHSCPASYRPRIATLSPLEQEQTLADQAFAFARGPQCCRRVLEQNLTKLLLSAYRNLVHGWRR